MLFSIPKAERCFGRLERINATLVAQNSCLFVSVNWRTGTKKVMNNRVVLSRLRRGDTFAYTRAGKTLPRPSNQHDMGVFLSIL